MAGNAPGLRARLFCVRVAIVAEGGTAVARAWAGGGSGSVCGGHQTVGRGSEAVERTNGVLRQGPTTARIEPGAFLKPRECSSQGADGAWRPTRDDQGILSQRPVGFRLCLWRSARWAGHPATGRAYSLKNKGLRYSPPGVRWAGIFRARGGGRLRGAGRAGRWQTTGGRGARGIFRQQRGCRGQSRRRARFSGPRATTDRVKNRRGRR